MSNLRTGGRIKDMALRITPYVLSLIDPQFIMTLTFLRRLVDGLQDQII